MSGKIWISGELKKLRDSLTQEWHRVIGAEIVEQLIRDRGYFDPFYNKVDSKIDHLIEAKIEAWNLGALAAQDLIEKEELD